MNWPTIHGKTVLLHRIMGHKDRRSLETLACHRKIVKYRNQVIKGTK